ncbi:MFS transporter [Chachezhania sediminis]|uniref:MFS transporter n=1 Tax=Chachezhania sediminis TaxID=2599291 RepID=UPI00131CF492|nr:MFS transporter [Chachezhania sediminis]
MTEFFRPARPTARNRQVDAGESGYLLGRISAAVAIFAAILASTTPSPLYPVYIAEWGLAPSAGTTIFATYAIGTLATLLLSGRLNSLVRDRRAILLPGLVMTALGAILFAMADNLAMLLIGRLMSGVSTGLITGTASALLHDLDRPDKRGRAATIATVAFTGGAFAGPCVSSLALGIDLAPLVTPFLVIAGTAMAAFIGLSLAAWPRSGAACIPAKEPATEPAAEPAPMDLSDLPGLLPGTTARQIFRLSCLGIGVAWGVGSMMMAVGVSVASDVFHVGWVVLAGLVPALFQLLAGIGQVLGGRIRGLTALLIGFSGLAVLQALIGFGAVWGLTGLFLLSVPLAGLAYGATFVGGAALVNQTSEPSQLGRRISGFYVVGYLSNMIPTFIAGLLIDRYGLLPVFTGFSLTVALVAATGVALVLRQRREPL